MLAKTNPVLAFTLTVALFSKAGMPPLAGLYSKAFLLFAAMNSPLYIPISFVWYFN
jgi:NADH-quinone oxidoreductase subunit N